MQKKKLLILAFSLSLIFITSNLSLAITWQPYAFNGDEYYEYQASWNNSGQIFETVFVLDFKSRGHSKHNEGELTEFSFTTKTLITLDSMQDQNITNLWNSSGMSMPMLLINPGYSFFFNQLELVVGEEMNLNGAGIIVISAEEMIAGRKGFVCRLYQNDKKTLVSEWVIDPKLGIPLRSRVYQFNKLHSEIVLLKYLKY